jgi:hypothetical protein
MLKSLEQVGQQNLFVGQLGAMIPPPVQALPLDVLSVSLPDCQNLSSGLVLGVFQTMRQKKQTLNDFEA